jgi:FAD:protein FMN transferase
MGTSAHVVVVGDRPDARIEHAAHRLHALERKWSRFIETSEVSRLNAFAGEHVVVSSETLQLVRHAVDGWRATGGRFDPTVLPALVALGYDRDFAQVAAHPRSSAPPTAVPAPGCDGIECDEYVGTVTLPPGVAFDPGGIGKGFAADLACAELVDSGAKGALVNVGGDLRARGEPPTGDAWDVALADPAAADREVARVALVDGAVATSSRARRRWRTNGRDVHHLVDPRTGLPARTRHATVSVIAGAAWWAEVVSKAVLVGDLDVGAADAFAAHVVAVDDDGVVTASYELDGRAA